MASPGDLVGGRYRLGEPVGHGGMGTVWTATDVVLGREVALKEVVPPPGLDAAQQAVLRERTLREARAAARLSIASAVTVYDVVEEGGRPWVVMERLDAPTLADCIRENGALPPDDVARIGLALLEALQAAHASGVLHPYQMVKDLRTGCETGNPAAVFDGDIDDFLEAGIRWRRAQAVAA